MLQCITHGNNSVIWYNSKHSGNMQQLNHEHMPNITESRNAREDYQYCHSEPAVRRFILTPQTFSVEQQLARTSFLKTETGIVQSGQRRSYGIEGGGLVTRFSAQTRFSLFITLKQSLLSTRSPISWVSGIISLNKAFLKFGGTRWRG